MSHLRLVASGDAISAPPPPVEVPMSSPWARVRHVSVWAAVVVLFTYLLSLLPE